jgi:NhaP-type Na+/H+ or K+/H+ antiporter
MLRKAVTVGGLFGAIALLGLLHQPSPDAFNAEAMAVFGFIVLAAFMLGDLAESIHLPHITGYLLTGIICGPYVLGLLDESVIRDLKLFDHLAVALIALSAGAALTTQTLRKGARLLSAVMVSQFFFSLVFVGGVVLLCSGVIPGFTLPFLVDATWGFKLASALCLGLVASAMSPAATIAIVHETKSKGPITDAILGISILNNVIVVVLFALGLSVAGVLAPEVFTAHSEHGVLVTLATSIGGAALLGGVLGLGLSYYIRYLGQELLLILIGLSFTLTWVAQQSGIDSVLAFIVAGFVARNAFPKEEANLSRIITKLSLPVYVVFFFLAGAGLHLDAVVELWAFAILLFGSRMAALYVGTRTGAKVGNGPDGLREFGWLGFGAQAGIALSMAKVLEHSFVGETGLALETIAVAGVALNELCGPILLKFCLGKAGETQTSATLAAQETQETQAENLRLAQTELETEDAPDEALPEWIADPHPGQTDPWGDPLVDSFRDLTRLSRNVRADLQSMVRDLRTGPIAQRRASGREFITQLRREFLRFHRRCMVIARSPDTTREGFLSKLASQRAQLAARWQDHILDRSAMANYQPERKAIEDLISGVDALVAGLPSQMEVPLDPTLLQSKENDSTPLRIKKWARRTQFRLDTGSAIRLVEVEQIGRFTLGSEISEDLEQVAALLAVTDRHLMSRARTIFEVYRRSLAQAADSENFQPGQWGQVLTHVREEMEEEFDLALAEVDRLGDEAVRATAMALGQAGQSFNRLIAIAGTPLLPKQSMRPSKVYDQRVKAMQRIEDGLAACRSLTHGVGNGLAMELELLRLQTRIRSLIQDRAREFSRDLQGRISRQSARVTEALGLLLQVIRTQLDAEDVERDDMESAFKIATEDFSKVLQEAKGISAGFLGQLESERAMEPLRSELSTCIDRVKDHFVVAENPPSLNGRGLPTPPQLRDVPFRGLVRQYMDAEVSRSLSTYLQDVLEELKNLQSSMEELDRGLTYNAEVCLAELEVLESGPVPTETRAILQEMLLETLERHANRLADEHAQCEAIGLAAEEQVFNLVLAHLETLQGLLVEGRFKEMETQLAKAQAFSRRKALRRQMFSLIGLSRHFKRISVAVFGEAGTEKARRILGLRTREQSLELSPESFEIPTKLVETPAVYQRIFQDASLEARDLLLGREKEVVRLQQQLMGKTGRPSRAAAILCEGATHGGALLHAISRSLSQDLQLIRHTPRTPQSVEDVEALLAGTTQNCLVLIEDLRWFVGLQVGGVAPLRRLADGILADRGKNAWLVSCEASSWSYLQHHLSLEGVFPEQFRAGRLDQEALRNAILSRHGMCGFVLNYTEIESSLLWRLGNKLRKKNAVENDNEAQIFEALSRESGGVLRDALALWLSSVKTYEASSDAITLDRPPPLPIQQVESLAIESLLCLRQIARQGRLNAQEHATHFQLHPIASESKLAQLAHWGLIERHEGDFYQLTAELEGSIYRVLHQKGLAG